MNRAPKRVKRMADGRTQAPGSADAVRTADRLVADAERPVKAGKPPKAAGFKMAARGSRVNPSIPRRSHGPSGPAPALGDQTGPRKPVTSEAGKGVDLGTPSGDRRYGRPGNG